MLDIKAWLAKDTRKDIASDNIQNCRCGHTIANANNIKFGTMDNCTAPIECQSDCGSGVLSKWRGPLFGLQLSTDSKRRIVGTAKHSDKHTDSYCYSKIFVHRLTSLWGVAAC